MIFVRRCSHLWKYLKHDNLYRFIFGDVKWNWLSYLNQSALKKNEWRTCYHNPQIIVNIIILIMFIVMFIMFIIIIITSLMIVFPDYSSKRSWVLPLPLPARRLINSKADSAQRRDWALLLFIFVLRYFCTLRFLVLHFYTLYFVYTDEDIAIEQKISAWQCIVVNCVSNLVMYCCTYL